MTRLGRKLTQCLAVMILSMKENKQQIIVEAIDIVNVRGDSDMVDDNPSDIMEVKVHEGMFCAQRLKVA